jgi:tetratricopeptide (TPR) repeat protein
MNILKLLSTFFLLSIIQTPSWAKKMENSTFEELLKKADVLCDQGNFPNCLSMLDFAMEKKAKSKEQKISGYLSLSGNNGKAGNFQAEIDFAKKALELDPNNFVALSNLGVGLMGIQDIDESEKTFKKLLEVDSTSPVAFYQLGVLYEQKRDDDKALNHYLQAVKYNPSFVDAHFNLSMIYARKKDFTKAIESMKSAKRHAPKDKDISQMLKNLERDLKSSQK